MIRRAIFIPCVVLILMLAACSGTPPSTPAAGSAATDQQSTAAMVQSPPASSAAAVPSEAAASEAASPAPDGGSPPPDASPAPASIMPAAANGDRCFPETNQCLSGRFSEFWAQNGGLEVFGFAITPAVDEVNRDTNAKHLTQWLERNRFEQHPENQPPYDVLLGRLGDDRLQQLGRNWQQEPRESGAKPDCLWFEQTGYNVCNQAGALGFRTYWETHGLEFDGQPGTSYTESLALFGLPLSEPKVETNTSGDQVLTQWFERARFEWHPNNPDQFKVLLGLLGNEVRFKW